VLDRSGQGSANPALTIMALASRLAQRMTNRTAMNDDPSSPGRSPPIDRKNSTMTASGKDDTVTATTTSGFAPRVLREYALLADGERGVLVGPQGDFAWMCAPRWDSDAVFSSLVGGPSFFAVIPVERHVWGGYYEEGSLI
jgi:hypothetical protein